MDPAASPAPAAPMRVASCPQCAASVELPPERIADVCSFCDSPLTVGAADDAEHADLVVPFVVPRARAASLLRAYMAGNRWAPEAVRNAARPERLSGIFIPFYLYDGVARSTYAAQVGVDWLRTERYTVTVNGKTEHRTRQVRETEWFELHGTHAASYTQQLVSGSRGLPEAEANALEPFDLGRALPFAPALTAGWIAERTSVSHAEATQTVANEVAERENTAIQAQFLPGDHVRGVRNQTELAIGEVRLALLPVWIATFRYEGTPLRLLVNGQTGEVIGTLPRSWWKIAAAVAAVLAVLAAGFGAVALFGGLIALLGGGR